MQSLRILTGCLRASGGPLAATGATNGRRRERYKRDITTDRRRFTLYDQRRRWQWDSRNGCLRQEMFYSQHLVD